MAGGCGEPFCRDSSAVSKWWSAALGTAPIAAQELGLTSDLTLKGSAAAGSWEWSMTRERSRAQVQSSHLYDGACCLLGSSSCAEHAWQLTHPVTAQVSIKSL